MISFLPFAAGMATKTKSPPAIAAPAG